MYISVDFYNPDLYFTMKKSSALFLLIAFSINASFSQSVGTVDGVFNVSDMGAASYSIPIKVPDGVGGLQPNIAISYNSQGGNGPLGMGWSISGLSAITRMGNTIYHDSKVNGVTLGSGDKFALDGNRLVLTSGSAYGAANTGYNTEVETFREIKASGSLGNGPLSFSVKDQNGLTYEYGGTGGYVIAQGSNTPYIWLMKKVSDLNGNYMTISYNIYDGAAFPNEIAYNKNSGNSAAPTNFVKFVYQGSIDFSGFGYLAGGKVSGYSVLKAITVTYNGGTERIYRSYALDYETDFYPHLKTITEKGAEWVETLKPTEFTYGAIATSYTTTNVWSGGVNTTLYDFSTGDFNGDGKTDLIQYCRNYSDCNTWALYESTGSGFNQIQTASFPTPSSQYTKRKNIPRNFFSAFFDYNGDGKDDFVYKSVAPYQSTSGSLGDEKDLYSILLSNGNSLTSITSPKPSNGNGMVSGDFFIDSYPLMGDFDGDGKTEILAISKYAYSPYRTAIIGENYLKPCTGGAGCNAAVIVATPLPDFPFLSSYTTGLYAVPNPDEQPKITTFDYNGDGKSDILYVNQGTAYIYTMNVTFDVNNKPVIGNPSFKLINSSGYPTIWHKYINVGDFNGDGKSDVLTYSTNAGWEVGYGKDDGLMNDINPLSMLTIYTQGFSTDNDVPTPVFVSDFNGDGKTDIYVYPRLNSNNSTNAVILYSKGNNEFYGETLTNANSMLAKEPNNYFLGDFTGDGQMDFLTKYPGNWPFYEFSFHPNETRHLLSKIKNGFGSETKVYYKPLTNSSVYSPGSNIYTYPYIKRTIPFKVVSTVNADNGVNNTGNIVNYTYTGLKFNAQGKGLMGFDKVSMFDGTTLMCEEKTFSLNTTYAYPYLSNVTTKYNNTNLISITSNTYGVYDYGNKRIFPYQLTSQQDNAITGEASTTTNSYYIPGNFQLFGVVYSTDIGKPFSITTNKGNGLETTVQNFTYPGKTNTPAFVYSRPSKITTTNTRQNEPSYTRVASFTYDNIKGNLSNTVSDPGTANAVTTSFLYDLYGNPTYKNTTAAGLPDRQVNMVYDPTHRYVIKSYNEAFNNIKKTAWYNSFTGLKYSDTDPDGFTTTYIYDAFGRIKTISNSNGQSSTHTYAWGGLPPSEPFDAGGCYYTGTVLNTGEKSYTIYDRLGREVKSSNNNFQNEWVHTGKWYNNKGEIIGITKPYTGLAFQTIANTFDNYGRLTQITAPEGNTTYSYLYENTSPLVSTYTVTQTNPASQQTKTITDRSGRKTQIKDAANNNLIYNYHSNGNIKEVTSGSTILQTYTYDAFNRLKERWDPNYGIYKYTYDSYGQTLSQTDPKNQTYTFRYDAMGRMDKKTGPEGDYIYNYNNNTGNNCGKMTLLTGPEGEINYVYGMGNKVLGIGYSDNGLTAQITGNALSNLQTKTFSYDNYGRLENQTHWPSNITLWYGYGSNSDLTQIVNNSNSVILYEKTGENAAGQTTSYLQSNPNSGYELTTDISYDPYNLLNGQTSYDNYGNTHRAMTYKFEATTGNLEKRNDNKYGLEETFTYDDLNRLTGIANTTNPTLDMNMQFSTRGNIEEKTDVGGSLKYDPANRLSLIELNPSLPSAIPEAMQELTYTPFDKVQTIDEGDYHTEFHYWPDGSRSMMATSNNNTGEQWYKIYVPGVETKYDIMSGQKIAGTYVTGPEGNVVGMVTTDFSADADYFVLTDHLGSFTQIVHSDGYIEEEKSFDAWGRLRDPQSWEPYASNIDAGQPQQLFDRGYTGHEHLPYYGIINMNGRLYDPVMGRMFSPDVNVNGSDNLQGYNRYTYAANNPLIYTDPDGNIWHIVIGAAIGGVINLGIKAYQGKINSFGDGVAAFGIGAVAGGLAAATGGAAFTAMGGGSILGAGGFVAGAWGGGTAAAVNYTTQGLGNSAYFGDPPPTAYGLVINTIAGAATGGIMNGIPALMNGRTFWNGDLVRSNGLLMQMPVRSPGVSINPDRPQANMLSNVNGNGGTNLNLGGDVKSIDYGKVYGKLLNHGFSKGHDGVLQFGNGNALGTMNNAVSVMEQVQPLLQNGPNQIMVNYNGSQYVIRCFAQDGVVIGANIFPNSSGFNTTMLGNIINYTFKP